MGRKAAVFNESRQRLKIIKINLKDRKRILIFTDWFLPGYKAGGPIQSCANLVDHLKDEYSFSVVTRDTDYCETVPYKNIKSDQWNISDDGVRVYYFSSGQLNKKNIATILEEESYDALYLNGIFSPYFTLLPLYLLRRKNKRIVVAARGMLAESALAIKKTKKRLFLWLAKFLRLFSGVIFQATKEEEVSDIQKVFGKSTVIKKAQNLPGKIHLQELPKRKKEKGLVRLVNIARIAPEKNLKYALEVLCNAKGNVEFDVYGPIYNQDYWNECNGVINKLPANIRVNYRGSMENSRIGEALKEYHFMFMPTRGENFGHIIIQSLSAGCPVIISDQTIWRGLESKKAGWDIPLYDAGAFVKTIEKAVEMSQEEYSGISESAFHFSSAYLNNNESVRLNMELFG